MKKKYLVEVISGKYEGQKGWTPYETPNRYGNVMVYFDQEKNSFLPYRVCLAKEKIKIKEELK